MTDNQYTPDRWILVSIESADHKVTKILSGWYGGYLDSDYWRLSSGVTKIETLDKKYLIHNESGSVYHCYRNREGLTGLTGNILNKWLKQSENSDIMVETIQVSEHLELTDE